MDGQGYLVNVGDGWGDDYAYIGQFKEGQKEGNGKWVDNNENKYIG